MKNIVLQPTFFEKFQCIGGACKNNCCSANWRIYFTKDEFKNIKRRMHSDTFKEIFKDSFILEKGKNNCMLKLDENHICKFLGEDGLCTMYTEVGPENMSLVCQVFPREIVHFLDSYERFLSVGCEEVVRLLTEEKEGILLEVKEVEGLNEQKIYKNCAMNVTADIAAKNVAFHYWNDMKILLLSVLQNRKYEFGERLVLLGIAVQNILKMDANKEEQKIKDYIANFVREIDMEQNYQMYRDFFSKIQKDGQKRALQTISYHLRNDNNFDKIKKKIKDRIDLKLETTISDVEGEPNKKKTNMNITYQTAKYQNAMKEYQEFMKDKEHWIENVMIEGFLAKRGLFRLEGGLWRNYSAMVITYSVFLFMLTCCLDKDSTVEDFAYYVSEISRTMFHDDIHTKNLEEHLQETESDSLAYMAVLVL